MVQSLPASSDPSPRGSTPEGIDGESVLTALEDADCRAILAAVGDRALSAGEIADACDLPLSTTYRKVDRLVAAGLLAEGTRVAIDRHNRSEYRATATDVRISLDETDRIQVTVTYRDDTSRATGTVAD